eukprot:Gb_13885 [translate_table: standard]
MVALIRKQRGMEKKVMHYKSLLVLFGFSVAFGSLVTISADSGKSINYPLALGINYGRVADNLPPPSQAVKLMQDLKVGYVKIYDADSEVLSALSGTHLQVAITVKNQNISTIASDPSNADEWIQTNVLPYYPSTLICTIMVGNEILSDYQNQATWSLLVPAMTNLHNSLLKNNLSDYIKVTTSLAMDVLSQSYPPSAGTFRPDINTSIMQPMLDFLNRTDSYVFLDVYPFFAWSSNPANISLDYAMFDLIGTSEFEDAGGLAYSNMLDAQLDAVVAAMEQLGYSQVNLAISETGWPSKGDDNQPGANVANAARYNTQLVDKALAYPPLGTPRRPQTFIPTFIFALFNENQKPGPTTERNWGMFYADGTPVYPIEFSKDGPFSHKYSIPSASIRTSSNSPSPAPSSPSSASSGQWCVVSSNTEYEPLLQGALDYACGAGADCSLIEPNQGCYLPNTIASHASYAFNSYWQKNKYLGATCDFNGVATLTNSDPSYEGCVFEHN